MAKAKKDESKLFTVSEYIDHLKKMAYQEIINTLQKKYKMDKEKAEFIGKEIDQMTRTKMRYLYTFDEKFITKQRIRSGEKAEETDIEYKEIEFWPMIVAAIPLYQSLGDTIGYYNGKWEFNYNNVNESPEFINEMIYEFIDLGGINDINIKNWRASDDTILYMATFKCLLYNYDTVSKFGTRLQKLYIESIPEIKTRHPGTTTMTALEVQKNIKWDDLKYDSQAIGAGSAMRSGCIGLFFMGSNERYNLVVRAIECSRITHNSAIAILASVTSALFTSYSIEKIPVEKWPRKLMKLINSGIVDNYIKKSRPHEYRFFERDKVLFVGQWEKYIHLLMSGPNPRTDIKIMRNPVQRYKYLVENFSKNCDIPGSCGDDATIMAYDSLLRCNGTIEKLLVYAALHPGDSDTVASLAFSWYAGLYHSPRQYNTVIRLFDNLEFKKQIDTLNTAYQTDYEVYYKGYYYDLYLTFAMKYLKKYPKNI